MEPEGFFNHVHRGHPVAPNLSHINPVVIFPTDLINIYFNIIPPSTSASLKSLSFRFPHNFLALISIHMPCPSIRDLVTSIVFGEEWGSWTSSLCYFLQSNVILYLLGPNIFPRTNSRTLVVSVCSSLIVGDQMRLTAYFHQVPAWRMGGAVSPLFMQGQPYAFLVVVCRLALNLSVIAWRFRIVAVIFVIVDLQYRIIL